MTDTTTAAAVSRTFVRSGSVSGREWREVITIASGDAPNVLIQTYTPALLSGWIPGVATTQGAEEWPDMSGPEVATWIAREWGRYGDLREIAAGAAITF